MHIIVLTILKKRSKEPSQKDETKEVESSKLEEQVTAESKKPKNAEPIEVIHFPISLKKYRSRQANQNWRKNLYKKRTRK